MPVSLSPFAGAGVQFFDNNGQILSGGKLYTYTAGTTTPQTTYTSSTGLVANTNPIILDSAGRLPAQVWLTASVSYKFVLATSADVVLGTYDNISGVNDFGSLAASTGATLIGANDGAGGANWTTVQGFIDDIVSSSGSSYVNFRQAGTGVVTRTVQSKLRDAVSFVDFSGVDPTGVGDSTTGMQAAIDYAASVGGGWVTSPPGAAYKITASLVLKTGVYIDLNSSEVIQYTSNLPIFTAPTSTFIQSWGIRNGFLRFNTQQTAAQPSAIGVRLSNGGNNYNWFLEDMTIDKACTAVTCPATAGSFAFVGRMVNIIAYRNASWAFNLDCDSGAGANTNITVINCWALQDSSSPIAGSRGMRLNALSMANIVSLFGDHLQGPLFEATLCDGYFGLLTAEACTLSAAGTQVSIITFSDCAGFVSEVKFVSNTLSASGGGELYMVRPSTGTARLLTIQNFVSQNNSYTGGAAIFEVAPTSGIRLENKFAALDRTVNLADSGTVKRVTEWNGYVRNPKGTTANRPTPPADAVGYLYLDTTLAAAGKPIWWNGTLWVDSTGTAA